MSADTSLINLRQIIFLALASALGMDSGDWKASFHIRQAFTNPSPPPPPADQDVLYYHLIPEAEAPLSVDSVSDLGQTCSWRLAPYRLNLVFYGPDAESQAWLVWRGDTDDEYVLRFIEQAREYFTGGHE